MASIAEYGPGMDLSTTMSPISSCSGSVKFVEFVRIAKLQNMLADRIHIACGKRYFSMVSPNATPPSAFPQRPKPSYRAKDPPSLCKGKKLVEVGNMTSLSNGREIRSRPKGKRCGVTLRHDCSTFLATR